MHRVSFRSYIAFWISFRPPQAPLNFLLPNQFPRPSKHKLEEEETNTKKTMETNSNMTPQTKWHGHAPDTRKTRNQAQTNHKTPKEKT